MTVPVPLVSLLTEEFDAQAGHEILYDTVMLLITD